MSWQASEWAKQQRTGSAAAKTVLLLLGDRADESHSCFPGVALLAWESEMSERSVRSAITTLREAGLIRVLRRGGAGRRGGGGGRRSNRYQLLLDGADTPLPQADDWTTEYDPAAARAVAATRRLQSVSTGEAARSAASPVETKPADLAGFRADKPADSGTGDLDKPADPAATNRQILPVPYKEEHPEEPSSSSGHARAAAAIVAVTDADDDEAALLAERLAREHRPRSLSGYVRRMAATRATQRGPSDLDLALAELRASTAAPRAGPPPAAAHCPDHPQWPQASCGPCRSERLERPREAPRRRWSPAPAT